ncbi:hypothetical protein K3556_06085 [Aliiroseovarius sp. M344]|uniref:hypothetical protein n=1 Tax=Aliiroseovarius sp. M344 TaxID=2867010 RepID=UPI0021ADA862|nr:hypothetical protein [Aliiroseovarius sp. M344]UWQ15454.1 hypothetical protein K3556_06085 [Aliiroseovarius sp. M344]
MGDQAESKLCVVCADSIPSQAIKCTRCQSYQNWRRHLSVGNSSLALLVALLAVIGPATEGLKDLLEWRREVLQKEVELAIANFTPNEASVLVSNKTDRSIVAGAFQCALKLPLDGEFSLSTFVESGYSKFDWPKSHQTIDFLVSYSSPKIELIAANSEAYVEYVSDFVSPPLRFSGNPEDEAMSYCYLEGKNSANSLVPNGLLLEPSYLLFFDALELIERADFHESQADEKADWISKIDKARGK